jgi:hypothetical protein
MSKQAVKEKDILRAAQAILARKAVAAAKKGLTKEQYAAKMGELRRRGAAAAKARREAAASA